MRHIEFYFLESTLRRGNSLEQLLGRCDSDTSPNIRWLELRPVTEGIEIWCFDVPDIGSIEFTDVYEFGSDDTNDPVACVSNPGEALVFAHSQLGALPEFWVNATMVGDEYLNFVRAGRVKDWRVVRA